MLYKLFSLYDETVGVSELDALNQTTNKSWVFTTKASAWHTVMLKDKKAKSAQTTFKYYERKTYGIGTATVAILYRGHPKIINALPNPFAEKTKEIKTHEPSKRPANKRGNSPSGKKKRKVLPRLRVGKKSGKHKRNRQMPVRKIRKNRNQSTKTKRGKRNQ